MEDNHHRYKGFNLLSQEDSALLRTLLRGEFFIRGFTNKNLRKFPPNKSSSQIPRILKRLRWHGLVKKVGHCYNYYLTTFGRQIATMALKLKEMFIIPQPALNF